MADPPPAYSSAGSLNNWFSRPEKEAVRPEKEASPPEKERAADDDDEGHPAHNGKDKGKSKGKSRGYLPLPADAPRYAELVIRSWDELVFVNFPADLRDGLEHIINTTWSPGVSAHYTYPNGFEWKLGGLNMHGKTGVLLAKRLLVRLPQYLAQQGWHLMSGGRLAVPSEDKHTLIFRQGEPVERSFCAISFMDVNKIQLIDSPTPSLKEAFTRTVYTWPYGIQAEKTKAFGSWQITCRGKPWSSSKVTTPQSMLARKVRLDILGVMDYHGYELVACIASSQIAGDGFRDSSGSARATGRLVFLNLTALNPEFDQSADTWLLASRV